MVKMTACYLNKSAESPENVICVYAALWTNAVLWLIDSSSY